MKTILPLTICLLLISSLSVQAQDEYRDQNLKLGAKAGINLYFISDDPNITQDDTGVGSEFGIFARIGDQFYVQPGLDLVSNRAFLVTVDQPQAGERDALVVRYLRVPVLIGYQTDYEGSLGSHVRFMLGPAFAYALGVKDNNLDLERKDIHKAQFSLNGGVGFDMWVFSLELMYHHGFSTVLNDDNAEGKGRAFSLTLGFGI